MRFADFGALHRAELSGALGGLTRLRMFHQDDAHIFCTHEQIQQEIAGCLQMLEHSYSALGFNNKFELRLSTRPEESVGSDLLWQRAEEALASSLDEFAPSWKVKEGDGAFYGPKIDAVVEDAIGRQHQCGTIQLDFHQPTAFELQYVDANGDRQTPVLVHRAICGSIERMMAILTEHYGGRWPLWLSPRQVAVCPVAEPHNEYCEQLTKQLTRAGFHTEIDSSNESLKKKVRAAQLAQFNYILVVGDKELEQAQVNVRVRDGTQKGVMSVEELVEHLEHETSSFE